MSCSFKSILCTFTNANNDRILYIYMEEKWIQKINLFINIITEIYTELLTTWQYCHFFFQCIFPLIILCNFCNYIGHSPGFFNPFIFFLNYQNFMLAKLLCKFLNKLVLKMYHLPPYIFYCDILIFIFLYTFPPTLNERRCLRRNVFINLQ